MKQKYTTLFDVLEAYIDIVKNRSLIVFVMYKTAVKLLGLNLRMLLQNYCVESAPMKTTFIMSTNKVGTKCIPENKQKQRPKSQKL